MLEEELEVESNFAWKRWVAVVLVAVVLYRLGGPFLKRTEEVERLAMDRQKEIAQLLEAKRDIAPGWEEGFKSQLALLESRLPKTVYSSDVAKYFVEHFMEQNPGALVSEFTPQLVSAVKATEFGGKVVLRKAPYLVSAKLTPQLLFSYLDHLDKYPGVLEMERLQVETGEGDSLQAKLTLNLFLQPKEWFAPKEATTVAMNNEQTPEITWLSDASKSAEATRKTVDQVKNAVSALEDQRRKLESKPQPAEEDEDDEEVSLEDQEIEPEGRRASKAAVPVRTPASKQQPIVENLEISVTRVIGNAVVIQEQLYEVGDQVFGWTLVGIDRHSKKVSFQLGEKTKEFKIP